MGISSLIYPDVWPDKSDNNEGFMHLAVETMALGLIDDVYLSWRQYEQN